MFFKTFETISAAIRSNLRVLAIDANYIIAELSVKEGTVFGFYFWQSSLTFQGALRTPEVRRKTIFAMQGRATRPLAGIGERDFLENPVQIIQRKILNLDSPLLLILPWIDFYLRPKMLCKAGLKIDYLRT